MKIGIHQPAYLPWLGYFYRISQVDLFIFLDSVQFGSESFQNRNKIKTAQGLSWLTIPIKKKHHLESTLINTELDDTQLWRKKHLKSIEMNYAKAPYFLDCYPKFELITYIPTSNLSEFCWQQLNFWLVEFQIKTKVVRSSQLKINSKKSDLVLDFCRHFNADFYLSGEMGRNYLNEGAFVEAGIKIEYQEFIHPVYFQQWGEFEPNMGIIDYWMNCGPGQLNLKKG